VKETAMSIDRAQPNVIRTTIQVEHIRIDSAKSYADAKTALDKLPKFDDRIRVLLQRGEVAKVRNELERIQGAAGLIIFSMATHGDWIQIVGERRNALQYVIGNVLVATQMTQYQLPAGLYAPLRVMLYENEAGTATFEYDRPSDLFGQFGDDRVTSVAKRLDQQIYDALIAAAN
jgi:hypothetical protein